ncbi:hypothetical protein KM043_018234 [Ampulex compressa]|nr:hypothetical protein KM043_018234 [Ampulex compressa]
MQTTTTSGLMKTKDQAAEAIKEYIAAMMISFGKKRLALRIDNGREYISRELESFLRKEEVEHQFTINRSVRIIEPKSKGQESSSQTEKRKALSLPTAEMKLPAMPTTQYAELEGPEDKCPEKTLDNENDREFQTSSPTPQVPQRRVSQRSTKNVPPLQLTYKVVTTTSGNRKTGSR